VTSCGHATPLAGAVLALATVVAAAGCSTPPPPSTAAPSTSAPAAPAAPLTPVPTPTSPPSVPTSTTTTTVDPPSPSTPLLTPLAAGTVLAVKIDNTAGSRPRLGVAQAVAVYVEPVEGGLTRVLALFSSSAPGGIPGEIGPIRSARESDVS